MSRAAGRGRADIVRFGVMFTDMLRELRPQATQIYADELTERELDVMLVIYGDPEATAFMSKMPVLMERMSPLINAEASGRTQEPIKGLLADGVLSDL